MKFSLRYVPGPGGLGPLYWRNEESGRLHWAVAEYLDAAMANSEMDQESVELVKAYCIYWCEAPCWKIGMPDKFVSCVAALKQAETRAQLSAALYGLLEFGIDPL